MQRVQVTLIDDIDGESIAEETITFGVEGKQYEIDLSHANADRLRQLLAPWVAAARLTQIEPAALPGTEEPISPSEVRAWALSQGQKISPRGRLPKGLIRDYLEAQTAPVK